MLRRAREGADLLPAEGQEDPRGTARPSAATASSMSRHRSSGRRRPASRAAGPGRSERHAGCRAAATALARDGARRRGGSRRRSVDPLVAKIGGEARRRRRSRRSRTGTPRSGTDSRPAGERHGHADVRPRGEPPGELSALRRAAENEDCGSHRHLAGAIMRRLAQRAGGWQSSASARTGWPGWAPAPGA